jgi:hypothetical protein
VLVLGAFGYVAAHSQARAQETTARATMREVFDALSQILPPAIAGKLGAADEKQREQIGRSIDQLGDATADLEQHGTSDDPGFVFLSRSLADDASVVRARWRDGRTAEVGYVVQRMTETCVACHARLPSDRQPSFASKWVQQVDTNLMAPLELARLDVATRQLDRALGRYEAVFEDPKTRPSTLDYSGGLADYLVIALRVKADPKRVSKALAKLAARPDLSASLARTLPVWRQALVDLGPELGAEPSIERARDILEVGDLLQRYPADRADLIHNVVASSILYRYLQTPDHTREERSTALFLLGTSEAFVRRSFEESESMFYLEQAVRAMPSSEDAEYAYAALEDEVYFSYSGSGGIYIPDDVQARLDELRALIDEAREETPSGPRT